MMPLKKIDWYIIRKFLGTFLLIIVLFTVVAIVFDITEKLDDFLDNDAPLSEIVLIYYPNFIPYLLVLYTPLFLFIATILFTSRLAAKSEIIAITNTGMSFRRFFRPYFVTAAIVCSLTLYANHWLLPNANKKRIAFENKYINLHYENNTDNIHMQVDKNTYMYVQNFRVSDTTGFKFSIDKFKDGKLIWKLRSEKVIWNEPTKQWKVVNYVIRNNYTNRESLHEGKDTLMTINFSPQDFGRKTEETSALNARELNDVIKNETLKGSDSVVYYLIEKYKRTAMPFAMFILIVIGVSLSARKLRGGTGLHLAIGIALCFVYIFFQQFSATFSTNSSLPAWLGVWIPNFLFAAIAWYLYRKAPK